MKINSSHALVTATGLALLTACQGLRPTAPVDVQIETTLPSAPSHPATQALDGLPGTWFQSSRGADDKDQFTARFSQPVRLDTIEIQTGDNLGSNSFSAGLLEISVDGKAFTETARISNGVARAELHGRMIAGIRLRPLPAVVATPSAPAPAAAANAPAGGAPRRGGFRRDTARLNLREINLVPRPAISSVTQKMCIISDTTETPDLAAWGEHARELCEQWYFRLVALLPSPGFEPTLATRLIFRQDKTGVADTSRETDINIAGAYVRGHTNDWGMVIHELSHVVQRYPAAKTGFTKPGWLVEGISDYVRLVHYEPEARRPRINPDRAKYTDAYKTTAGFLEWIEKNRDRQIVTKFNIALRAGEFEDGLWKKSTGQTVDELWKDFTDTLRKEQATPATAAKP